MRNALIGVGFTDERLPSTKHRGNSTPVWPMRPAIHITRACPAAIRVNAAEVEMLLQQGWRLTDMPDCSGARVLPPRPVSVKRVPQNHKKMTGQGGRREPVKRNYDNAPHISASTGKQ
jgi:hypothetical protein